MKVLHAAFQAFPSKGILAQMVSEQQAAEALGIPWHSRLFCPDSQEASECVVLPKRTNVKGRLAGISSRLAMRREFFGWLNQVSSSYDLILLRYLSCDVNQLAFVRRSSVPVWFVHHSIELHEIALPGTAIAAVKKAIEEVLGPMSFRHRSGTVAVTHEILRHEVGRAGHDGKPGFVYPNGVNYDREVIRDRRGTVPECLFVASHFAPWHGLDKLLERIHGSTDAFVMHIVGTVPDDLRKKAESDARVRLHGPQASEAIERIAESCWVGLSSFALDRNGMEEACTLKVREYLRMGLPVYSGHRDVFPETFSAYRVGPPDPIAILEFCHLQRTKRREDIACEARPYVDKIGLLRNLYDALVGSVSQAGAEATGLSARQQQVSSRDCVR